MPGLAHQGGGARPSIRSPCPGAIPRAVFYKSPIGAPTYVCGLRNHRSRVGTRRALYPRAAAEGRGAHRRPPWCLP
eukprot:5120733-Prymnesium_polylepis.1